MTSESKIIESILNSTQNKDYLEEINLRMFKATRVQNFFRDKKDLAIWKSWYESGELNIASREYGDYQTSMSLASKVSDILESEEIRPETVIEPTFGLGNFIIEAIRKFDSIRKIYGVEIQSHYFYQFKKTVINLSEELKNKNLTMELYNDDFFTHDFSKDILKGDGDILILGNPPWVTVAELNRLSSSNIPKRSNIKGLTGLDAKLGKSNFDIAEYIIIQLLDQLNDRKKGTLAMLCKNSTIKNIVHSSKSSDWNITAMKMYQFDVKKEFNAATEASLFIVQIGDDNKERSFDCSVYDLYNPKHYIRTMGWVRDKFVFDVDSYEETSNIDNESPLKWRSGIKHDCAKVMEFTTVKDNKAKLMNGFKEVEQFEDEYIYSLLKSSDLKKESISNQTRKKVIITQTRVGEDTSIIEESAPATWKYLNRHKIIFDNRKSSIYKGKPPFSIFGIGDYSFSPYKVAISSMYKNSDFTLVMPISNKPVMLDDTCNFMSFEVYEDALFTFLLLNNKLVQTFLKSITFMDSQRPYTIETLKRIDLIKVSEKLTFEDLLEDIQRYDIHIPLCFSKEDYSEYKLKLKKTPSSFNNIEESNDNIKITQ